MTLEGLVAPAFVLFCRIGGCLMTAPGFSSERVPVRARLYLALAITVAMAPALLDAIAPAVDRDPVRLAGVIISELATGVFLGLLARFYVVALETLLTAVSMTIGLGNIFGSSIHDSDPIPALGAFVTLGAVTLIFATDQHLEIIRALYLSYKTAPVLKTPGIDAMLDELTRVLTQSHLLALRISSPFLIFGLIVNLAFGFLARLTPQVPIYFVSGPFVIYLGLYAFYLVAPDFFAAFIAQVSGWLARG